MSGFLLQTDYYIVFCCTCTDDVWFAVETSESGSANFDRCRNLRYYGNAMSLQPIRTAPKQVYNNNNREKKNNVVNLSFRYSAS